MVNGLGGNFMGKVHEGAGLAIGASIALGGVAWLCHHFLGGIIPHEFILGGGLHRGCCSKHPKHHCGGCQWHPRPGSHSGYNAMAGTMNTLGPGGDGRFHLY